MLNIYEGKFCNWEYWIVGHWLHICPIGLNKKQEYESTYKKCNSLGEAKQLLISIFDEKIGEKTREEIVYENALVMNEIL